MRKPFKLHLERIDSYDYITTHRMVNEYNIHHPRANEIM